MAKVSLPQSFDRGAFGIERPGTYHLIVIAAEEYPQTKKGEAISGWRINCGVLAGTEDTEKGKEISLVLRHPSGQHKDGGDFCQRVQARFLLSTCLVSEDQAGKEVDIDLEGSSPLRQFVAKFAVQKKQKAGDPDRIDLDGANIWHVDDSYVAEIPKDANNLKSIPQSLRMIGGQNSQAAAKPEPATEYSEPAASGSGAGVDYDSL